jgi:hypothetical protein
MSEKKSSRKNTGKQTSPSEREFMTNEMNIRFKVLEESILTLRQEVRDSFGQVEARLENLRARMAEIQTVLIEWREERPFNLRSTRHN